MLGEPSQASPLVSTNTACKNTVVASSPTERPTGRTFVRTPPAGPKPWNPAAGGKPTRGLPRWSAGFVYVPAFVVISAASILVAPFGARLAHRLTGPTLRHIFAIFLLAIGAKVAVSV